MAFEVFKDYGSASRCRLTLRAAGRIFISRGILKRLGFAEIESVRYYSLLFDNDLRRLAILLMNQCEIYIIENKIDNRQVIYEKTGISINMFTFMKAMDIALPPKKIDFQVECEEINGVKCIVFDIDNLIYRESLDSLEGNSGANG